jgi:site-specific recombinase XerD
MPFDASTNKRDKPYRLNIKTQMITIKLYQKAKKLRADGTAPIYYVLSQGQQRKLISTKRYLKPEFFDNKSGLVLKGGLNSAKLNNFFRSQMTALDNIIIDLTSKGQEVTFEKIEQIFTNDYGSDFISFAFRELSEQKGLISDKTYDGYKERLNTLKKYRSEIPFNAINHDFLTRYKHYQRVTKERSINGVYNDFAVIKKFYRIALLKGEATGNPFLHFPLEREITNRNWLTEKELGRLHSLLEKDSLTMSEILQSVEKKKETGANKRITDGQKNTLRHFLFSCYTGLRFGDNKELCEKHVIEERLMMKTGKTGKHVDVPFNRQAKSLVDAVLTRPLKQMNKRVNSDLKACIKAAEIKKAITFHCSRHTFAINCLMLGIDLLTVRDWLGHASVTTTEIYAKLCKQYQDDSMKKWEHFGKLKVA